MYMAVYEVSIYFSASMRVPTSNAEKYIDIRSSLLYVTQKIIWINFRWVLIIRIMNIYDLVIEDYR